MPDIPAFREEPRVNFAILEALFQCYKNNPTPITQDEVLQWIIDLKLRPQLHALNHLEFKTANKFAFVVHPLSISHLFTHPAVRPLRGLSGILEKPLEFVTSKLPPTKYGTISGIKSEFSGQETTGSIYLLLSTPRMMKNAEPENIYDDLLDIAQRASDEGCDIMGLGAYTKIVGDGGVTVSQRSPIPVTTGNSLSAAATLWAARIACEKMGFLKPFKFGSTLKGRAMVIGATGSIGAVSAKLLANVFEEVVLVAPRPDKLLEIKENIEALPHVAKIQIAVNPDLFSSACDLIVTSTSSIDERVLDIMKVKPGCVICDVSRPLAIGEAETIKRPDVLVIESGEVELPGNVKLTCDIGLQESVVYACLAETALLALEGRMESFTLSRNIAFEKVQEIYDLAKKHGARLAKIRGHAGVITDQEIALCREHALRNLKKQL
jgi:predicted amino acid dehydrogenase